MGRSSLQFVWRCYCKKKKTEFRVHTLRSFGGEMICNLLNKECVIKCNAYFLRQTKSLAISEGHFDRIGSDYFWVLVILKRPSRILCIEKLC